MLTCIIRYDIDPTKRPAFEQYARNWGQCIPRNGADLIGYLSFELGFNGFFEFVGDPVLGKLE